MDFRKDKDKNKRKENFLKGLWLGGEEKKMMVGSGCFILKLTKNFFLQNKEFDR